MEKGGNEEQGKKGRKRNTEAKEAKARRTVLKKDDQIEEGIRARAREREREGRDDSKPPTAPDDLVFIPSARCFYFYFTCNLKVV